MILKPQKFSYPIKGHPLAKGLVGCWLMNEGSGSKIFDLSGNGNIGSLVADTHFVPGKFGPALSFDGTGDYVKTMDSPPSIINNGTISVWFNSAILDYWGTIVGYTASSAERLYIQSTSIDNGTFQVQYYDGSSSFGSSISASFGWHHIALVTNGISNNIIGYFDGVLMSGSLASGNTWASAEMVIGARTRAGVYDINFNGLIDNVMIFNRSLSAQEVAQLYCEPFCMFRRNPIELWSAATQGGQTILNYERSVRGINRGIMRGVA